MRKTSFILVLLFLALGVSAQDDITYSFGGNAWVGSENADDKGTPAEGLVSDASFNVQINYKFPTKKESSWIPMVKSVQQYVSARGVQFRSKANQDGIEWIENIQAFGVVYGRRYFLRDDYQGFNVGWYLGVATAKTEGYEYNPSVPGATASYYEENLILPLNALEINYHFEWKFIYIEPTYALYVNSGDFTFEGYPAVIVGLQFAAK